MAPMWKIPLQVILHTVPDKWDGRLRDHCEAIKSRYFFSIISQGLCDLHTPSWRSPPDRHMQFVLTCNFQSHDNQISYWFSFERKEKQNHHHSPPKKNIRMLPLSWGGTELQNGNLRASNTPRYKDREWKQSAQGGIARELSVNSIHHLLWKMAACMNTPSQERKGQGSH